MPVPVVVDGDPDEAVGVVLAHIAERTDATHTIATPRAGDLLGYDAPREGRHPSGNRGRVVVALHPSPIVGGGELVEQERVTEGEGERLSLCHLVVESLLEVLFSGIKPHGESIYRRVGSGIYGSGEWNVAIAVVAAGKVYGESHLGRETNEEVVEQESRLVLRIVDEGDPYRLAVVGFQVDAVLGPVGILFAHFEYRIVDGMGLYVSPRCEHIYGETVAIGFVVGFRAPAHHSLFTCHIDGSRHHPVVALPGILIPGCRHGNMVIGAFL